MFAHVRRVTIMARIFAQTFLPLSIFDGPFKIVPAFLHFHIEENVSLDARHIFIRSKINIKYMKYQLE